MITSKANLIVQLSHSKTLDEFLLPFNTGLQTFFFNDVKLFKPTLRIPRSNAGKSGEFYHLFVSLGL